VDTDTYINQKASKSVHFAAFLCMVAILYYTGFIFSCLWEWFFVPLGLSNIGIAWSIGICATVHLCTLSTKTREPYSVEEIVKTVLNEFLVPTLLLIIGYICSINMPGGQ
jgi:hypothetical protein